MKICFNLKPNDDKACGGGVKFAIDFRKYLLSQGHKIVYTIDFNSPPDCVFMFDFKKYNCSEFEKTLDTADIKQLKMFFTNIPIIHRVNDIGLPKRNDLFTKNMSKLANISTHVIFISEYCKEHYKNRIKTDSTVIHNGVDRNVFSFNDNYNIDTIKLITHHWSDDLKKGWDFYTKIDEWIGHNNVEFTFVGRLPRNINLKNTKIIKPKNSLDTAKILKSHNMYVTASKFEPCGKHHIEGLSCGLPLLYRDIDSGGIIEAGFKFGVGFSDFSGFKESFDKVKENYLTYHNKIKNEFNKYYSNDIINKKYLDVIEKVVN